MLEKLLDASILSIVGFSIVFGILLLLIIAISTIKWLDNKYEERGLKKIEKEKASKEAQNIDDTSLVLISAAVATYFMGRARIKKVRVLPSHAKTGGSWTMQARTTLQASHSFAKK